MQSNTCNFHVFGKNVFRKFSILEFKLILANARGGWWDRLALNFDAHLKDKDRAMKAVIAGLEDPVLGDRDRLSLQVCSFSEAWILVYFSETFCYYFYKFS